MLRNLRAKSFIVVLVVLHTVGVIGLSSPYRELFQMLTPINLMLSGLLVILSDRHWNAREWGVLLLCFAVGFGVEVLGVATGVIFGEYYYGATLGTKLFEVPIVIGFNWALLVYGSAALTSRFMDGAKLPVKAAVSAAIMVFYDVLMEPVAIRLDFWHWPAGSIPLQNYFAWFVVAFGLCLVTHRVFKRISNPVAIALIAVQLVFFGALNFIG